MSIVKKYNEDLAKEIRKCSLEKQLNIFIGSGCSSDAMPLMSQYSAYSQDEASKRMIKDIIRISKWSVYMHKGSRRVRNTRIGKRIIKNQLSYTKFMSTIVDLLNLANSRQVPRTANIFTTNYDLFVENAMNTIHHCNRFVFNDGANGYFERILDSTNYNRVVAYRGLNDNYISEIPSLNLIKSHGSVNWERKGDKIIVLNDVSELPMVVLPTGYESQETFLNNYFHDMLRVFQLELDKPQSVLLVIGFSFQDQHIARMLTRALQNPELIIYVFVFRSQGEDIKRNLQLDELPSNLKIVTPSLIYSEDYFNDISKQIGVEIDDLKKKELSRCISFTLDNLSEILRCPEIEIEISEEFCNEE